MEVSNKVEPDVKEKEIVKEQKAQSCCGPTCCGGSDNKTNSEREEK